MVKQTRTDKNEEKKFKKGTPSIEDIPEKVFEIFAVLADAAIIMLKENNMSAFSGRHDEFIFTLVYDPLEEIDDEYYKSAITDVIKKADPDAIGFDVPSPFNDDNDEEDNL
jgi:hypothetical protein